MASTTTPDDGMRRPRVLGALLWALGLVALAGCSRVYVAPVLPSAYTEQIEAPYEAVWRALVRALARENVQIRAIACDSGVIASEAVPTPASTMTGTPACSLMIRRLLGFWIPSPEPIGAPSGMTAA